LLEKEYKRLSRDHDFSLPEKPFCIVVPTLNNGKDFRYEYNLRSIFNQNYTNYKVVIIDDASTDQNYELIQQYLEENPVSQ
jgi:glycosyltransferase involved in cell wall biosynthesis